MTSRFLSTLLGTFLIGAGAHAAQAEQTAPTDPRDPLLNQGPKEVAVGEKVMVSTQLPIVTEAALEVLRKGGNAVDAYITAVFMQTVNDYHQVSLFGMLAGLYYDAPTDTYYTFDAYSERPRADRCGDGDPSKVAIAGKVRGLEALAERFGTRDWANYLEPAIASAEEGALVTSFMYANNYNQWENGALIQQNEQAREHYMPEGHLVPVGGQWKMPKLAETLRRIASEGADYMYTGAWARTFVDMAGKKGFCVSMEDMAAYEVRWGEPLRTTYRGYEIITEGPPKKGGIQIAYNLNVLENFDLAELGHYTESPETLEILARTFGRVEDDIRYSVKDPRSFRVPTHIWLSKDYARIGADFVRATMVQPGVDLTPTSKSARFDAVPARPAMSVGDMESVEESNHNVIVDAAGSWITSLHTGHGGAPGVFIDGVRATGSGFPAETAGPGRRLVANATGTIVAKDGKPWLSLGSPGVPPQPVTEVLVNIIDFGMHPKDAAAATRFFAFRTDERVVAIESRISDRVRKGMAARGIRLRDLGAYNWHTGSIQIVWRDPDTGKLHGVTDPRRLGLAAGF